MNCKTSMDNIGLWRNQMRKPKKVIFALLAVTLTVVVYGCGEKETNAPAVKLTASAVSSLADTSTHVHTVSIPFTDVSASPTSDIYQYRSDTIDGHSHVIALTKQQIIDINNGMRVNLTSSTSNAGTGHTHTWSIQGGDLLYEKNCYNCHTNDKRGHSPMNVSFNGSQTSAVISPGGAPLSTSASATPDPNYTPSTVVSLDGASLYTANCAVCHGALASSSKLNRTFAQIKSAISSNTGGMSSLGALTDAQLQAIATALVK
jgi:mono/diheme cytochrome c family protein